MSTGDIVIIAVLALCVIVAVIFSVRNKGKCSCSGNCECCGVNCNSKIDRD